MTDPVGAALRSGFVELKKVAGGWGVVPLAAAASETRSEKDNVAAGKWKPATWNGGKTLAGWNKLQYHPGEKSSPDELEQDEGARRSNTKREEATSNKRRHANSLLPRSSDRSRTLFRFLVCAGVVVFCIALGRLVDNIRLSESEREKWAGSGSSNEQRADSTKKDGGVTRLGDPYLTDGICDELDDDEEYFDQSHFGEDTLSWPKACWQEDHLDVVPPADHTVALPDTSAVVAGVGAGGSSGVEVALSSSSSSAGEKVDVVAKAEARRGDRNEDGVPAGTETVEGADAGATTGSPRSRPTVRAAEKFSLYPKAELLEPCGQKQATYGACNSTLS